MLDSEAGPWPGSQGGLGESLGCRDRLRIHLRIIGLTRWSACSLAEAWLQEGNWKAAPGRACRHVAPLSVRDLGEGTDLSDPRGSVGVAAEEALDYKVAL